MSLILKIFMIICLSVHFLQDIALRSIRGRPNGGLNSRPFHVSRTPPSLPQLDWRGQGSRSWPSWRSKGRSQTDSPGTIIHIKCPKTETFVTFDVLRLKNGRKRQKNAVITNLRHLIRQVAKDEHKIDKKLFSPTATHRSKMVY